MKLFFKKSRETKTCYVFEHNHGGPEFTTLYLKKSQVDNAKINPEKGVCVTIEEAKGE